MSLFLQVSNLVALSWGTLALFCIYSWRLSKCSLLFFGVLFPLVHFLLLFSSMLLHFRQACVFSQRHIHNYTHTHIYIYIQYTLYIYGTFVVSLLSSDHHLLEDVLRKQRFRMVPEGCKARGGTLHCCPTTAHICPSTYVCTWKYDENPR